MKNVYSDPCPDTGTVEIIETVNEIPDRIFEKIIDELRLIDSTPDAVLLEMHDGIYKTRDAAIIGCVDEYYSSQLRGEHGHFYHEDFYEELDARKVASYSIDEVNRRNEIRIMEEERQCTDAHFKRENAKLAKDIELIKSEIALLKERYGGEIPVSFQNDLLTLEYKQLVAVRDTIDNLILSKKLQAS